MGLSASAASDATRDDAYAYAYGGDARSAIKSACALPVSVGRYVGSPAHVTKRPGNVATCALDTRSLYLGRAVYVSEMSSFQLSYILLTYGYLLINGKLSCAPVLS